MFEEGIEVEYASELNIIWLIKKGSILNFQHDGMVEILDLDTYFKDTDNHRISFLIVAYVRTISLS